LGHGKKSLLAIACTCALAYLILWSIPALEMTWFVPVAAHVASLFSGAHAGIDNAGWILLSGNMEVLVSRSCSGTGFFVILSALLSCHLAGKGWRILTACFLSLLLAGFLAPLINGFRITVVVELHRWILPYFPQAWHAFLHMLAGAAVFLPVLVFVNFLLEKHARDKYARA